MGQREAEREHKEGWGEGEEWGIKKLVWIIIYQMWKMKQMKIKQTKKAWWEEAFILSSQYHMVNPTFKSNVLTK